MHPTLRLAGLCALTSFAGACAPEPTPPSSDIPNGPLTDPPDDGNEEPPPPPPPLPPACATPVAPVSTAPTTSEPWELMVIDTATYPLAVCNDGSPATFGIRRNSQSTKWLVFLKGGGKCVDGPTCLARSKATPKLMSSKPTIKAFEQGDSDLPTDGIFATNPTRNPAWHNANLVEVLYCTSDTWQGDAAANENAPADDVGHWHFRGHEVVRATLKTLHADFGFANATDVTLAGGSAGAAGVYANADDVAELLPGGARYIAIADGGYVIDYPSFDPATGLESTADPTESASMLTIAHANWGGRGDASCDALATSDAGRAACRMGASLLQGAHVGAPLFVVNSQIDHNALSRLGIDNVEHIDAAQSAYITRFGAAMRASLGLVDARYPIFAAYSTQHVSLNSSLVIETEVDDVLMMQALVDWHATPCDVTRRIEEEGESLPFGP